MNNTELMLLNIGISKHNGDWNWQDVESPFIRIFYAVEGTAQIIFQEHAYTVEPGNMYLIPPFTKHSYNCDGYYSHIYIHLYEKPSSQTGLFDLYDFPVDIKCSDLNKKIIQRLLDINPGCRLSGYDPKFYDNQSTLLKNIAQRTHIANHILFESRGILLQLLAAFISKATKKNEYADIRVTKALSYIRRNIDSSITINQLSCVCNLSDDHFIRLFKKETGLTPVTYIIKKKIEKAQLLLTISEIPIKDVALKLNFENISYFNKLFKSHTGMTPTQYINKNNLRQHCMPHAFENIALNNR